MVLPTCKVDGTLGHGILKTASQKQPGAWPSTAMSGAHSGTLAVANMLTTLPQFLKSSLCREDFTANTYSKRWAALQAPELPCSKLEGLGGDRANQMSCVLTGIWTCHGCFCKPEREVCIGDLLAVTSLFNTTRIIHHCCGFQTGAPGPLCSPSRYS